MCHFFFWTMWWRKLVEGLLTTGLPRIVYIFINLIVSYFYPTFKCSLHFYLIPCYIQCFPSMYCMLKEKCEKEHLKEECSEGSYCESIQTCALRHPKMCKRIVMEGLCHFGNKCAYNHKRIYHSQSIHADDVHSDLQKLKGEVDSLKNTIQSLFS